VEQVGFNGITSADGFLARVGGRLPDEFEWEFAARGGTLTQDFRFAGSNNADEVAWYSGNRPTSSTQPVGGLAANELGLYDMSGNVREWTSTVSGSVLVSRGGSWSSVASDTRVAFRGINSPDGRLSSIGFRVAFAPNSN